MKTVFVGLSGGVDSSVAALRLQNQGYNVVGVFIKVWHPEWIKCNWEEERLDAMRVAARLEIPFLTCDAADAYRDEVAHYFIDSYKAGFTPNPDVLCNQHVKFGAFLDFALAHGAEYVATGHYAQRLDDAHGVSLLRGLDTNKDQSYFLWTLTRAQLEKTLFPVGDTPKPDIRLEAEAAGLSTSAKKDSQGICFLGHIDIEEFLSHYTTLEPGQVLNESGDTIGEHKGSIVYTLGQRHGFTVHTSTESERPHFVVSKDLEKNTITVATQRPQTPATSDVQLGQTNWINFTPHIGDTISMQSRYRQTPFPATITAVSDTTATLSLVEEAETIAAGQSAVFYEGEKCLGGGIIMS